MRLELRGLLLDLVPNFAVKQHEGREALFRHGFAAPAFRGCFARLVSAAPAQSLPPLGAQALLGCKQALWAIVSPSVQVG